MNSETLHYDNARTGWFKRNTPVTTTNESGRPWGLYNNLSPLGAGAAVRGAVMFLQNWRLQGGQRNGEIHTMLYFATSANEVFAFSEEELRDPAAKLPIWQVQLGRPSMRQGSNIPPPVGACSTVVLDPQQRRLFVMALIDDGNNGENYHIFSLSLDTGVILAQASLQDAGAGGRATFVGRDHDQRGALLLDHGRVFTVFADFLADDNGPYFGWLVACRVDNLADQSFLPANRTVHGGGIWGPGGASADAAGNIYAVTGNATDGHGNDEIKSYWDGLPTGKHPGDLGDFFEGVFRAVPSTSVSLKSWGDPIQIPGWWGNQSAGGNVAVAHLPGVRLPVLIGSLSIIHRAPIMATIGSDTGSIRAVT